MKWRFIHYVTIDDSIFMLNIRGKKTYVVLGAILVLLVFLNYVGWLDFLKTRLRSVFLPLFTQSNNISVDVGNNFEFFKDKKTFFDAYRQCRTDLENKSIEESKIKLLEEENSLLKEALKFKESTTATSVIARVVGKNIEQTDQTILIDKGTESGVKVEQPVIVGNGILVGKIVKAEAGLSVVRLLNDNSSKVGATILNTDRSLGVVEGGYGLSVKMNFIPRNEIVKVGDIIVTSGLEAGMPRGLLIGSVTAIENETYRPFQAALLLPGTDLSKLSIVSILIAI